jgi:hypothetical protein
MAAMEASYRRGRAAGAAIGASLVAGGVFVALTVLADQDVAGRAALPWRADPYHTAIGLAELVVPALALAIVVRLFVWRAPGGPDRAQQTVRAAGTMTALVGAALAFEWAAVIGATDAGRHPAPLVGLGVTSLLVAVATVLLVRSRRPAGAARRWRRDWLGDAALACRWTPLPRSWTSPPAVDAVRRHALALFVGASGLAGAALAGAQSIGEQLTDPLLIGWYFVVATVSLTAFCLVGNAVAGFVVRPAPGRIRRAVEAALVTGGSTSLLAVAFRDPARAAVGLGPVTSVPTMAWLTLGTGLGVAVLTAAALLLRTPESTGKATG